MRKGEGDLGNRDRERMLRAVPGGARAGCDGWRAVPSGRPVIGYGFYTCVKRHSPQDSWAKSAGKSRRTSGDHTGRETWTHIKGQ